ncbi:hypothetical protein [Peribacillus simplex]|uniref:hypothetical protein n=1 Tax=Peribacillus simplex TaxID=1478 RepID=UPI0024C15108|nr:hypothetical protein [Peribacillus simplex]WHY56143.1 hypothetical protein QNH43_23920 [Peribacillus simplex]
MLAPRRLGRQSAERERISENQLECFLEKTVGWSHPELCLRLVYPSCFFTVILIGWKKFATLLPNNWLAETPQVLAPRRLGRQSAERERISENQRECFLEKTVGWSHPELCLRLVYPSCFFTVILIGWKKFATLLPNNWLVETPQALAPRRLGRQSAERERISENQRECFLEKTVGWSHPELCLRLVYPSCFFTVILIGWKKFATLLPNNWLAETPQALASRRLGRQSAERERISENQRECFLEKTVGKLAFLRI